MFVFAVVRIWLSRMQCAVASGWLMSAKPHIRKQQQQQQMDFRRNPFGTIRTTQQHRHQHPRQSSVAHILNAHNTISL